MLSLFACESIASIFRHLNEWKYQDASLPQAAAAGDCDGCYGLLPQSRLSSDPLE